MRKYKPEKMVAISRYQKYFPTLSDDIQRDVYSRMAELIVEEKQYCDKGNYKHMAQILTSIAMYEVLQKRGWSEEDAYKAVSEEMWKFLDPSGMQKLARKRFFLPLIKKIVPFGFRKGSGFGWRYTWHRDDPKDEFHFECNECIYEKILRPCGMMKLGAMCCHADVINYCYDIRPFRVWCPPTMASADSRSLAFFFALGFFCLADRASRGKTHIFRPTTS